MLFYNAYISGRILRCLRVHVVTTSACQHGISFSASFS